MNIHPYLSQQAQKVESALDKCLPRQSSRTSPLAQAMRYSVLGGGKRIRPILVLEACRAVGGKMSEAMPAALAVELIHSYSLVHDDLPCMDNDMERRGKPSCHAAFGQETALLAGDALLTLAFEVLAKTKKSQAIAWLAEAAGAQGMVGGQSLDLQSQHQTLDSAMLEAIHIKKTGALIAVSARMGALLGGGSAREIRQLYQYGKMVGFLFQIVDDILDQDGYAKAIGVSESIRKAQQLVNNSKSQIDFLSKRVQTLRMLPDVIFQRINEVQASKKA